MLRASSASSLKHSSNKPRQFLELNPRCRDSVVLLWRGDGRFRFIFGDINNDAFNSLGTFPPGSFYHVAATYDGTDFKLFVNGTPQGTMSRPGYIIPYNSFTWTIGSSPAPLRNNGYPRTWNGIIDEVEIFDHALSQSEIEDIFNAGSAGKCRPCGGSIVAWGFNESGQTIVPAPNTDFVAIAAGQSHSLGLKSDGSIVGWGNNGDGQTTVPLPNADFIGIAAGQSHSLGLKANGSVVGWGHNGDGETTVPAPNSGFVAVSAGLDHSLGLKAAGNIVAWGSNLYGNINVPGPNSGFVAVAAGHFHSLGLKSDGTLVAWGDNITGQTNVPAPNPDFIGIAAGGFHNLVLRGNGTIEGWGNNNYGETTIPAPNSGFVAIAAGEGHSLGLKLDIFPCDDGNACTHTDRCSLGICSGTAYICNDGNACTDDTCNGDGTCTYPNLPDNAPCDDGDPDTNNDVCFGGVCAGTVVYGDVNRDGVVDLNDILCVLDDFGNPNACSADGDIFPCGGDGIIDLNDILAVLDAFGGNYGC